MRISRTVRLSLPLLLGTLLLLVSAGLAFGFRVAQSRSDAVTYSHTVIIDAGHGGFDGGAVGVNGTVEKDVNLSISLALRDLLRISGCTVYMTRETDTDTADADVDSTHARKVSDMYNRLALIDAHPEAVTVCIHQNLYTESQYSGAQMFYSQNNPQSKTLAQCLQTAFVELLQPDNTREIKPAGKSLFLLYYSQSPTVLAECGFLSNPQEEALLSSSEYQYQIAITLYQGLLSYWEESSS